MLKQAITGGAAALVLLASVPATAQDPAPHARASGPEAILQHQETLGLTGEQVERLEAIAAELRERNAPLREQVREFRGERPRHGAGEMSPEQRERMREMRERMRDMTAEQRREMHERMREMTPEQRREMHERMHAQRGDRAAMRERRGDRSAGVRGSRAVPEEVREAMRQMMEHRREAAGQARAVLSEAQLAQLRELARERRQDRGQRRGAGERGPRR